MHSSAVPIGKRPEFKQSRSAGWSWPRLVPIHEQPSRLSQAVQSSASPSPRGRSEQEEPPTAMISTILSNLHAEEDVPISPVSAAGSPPNAGGSVAGAVKHPPNEYPRDSSSSMADSDDEKRRAAAWDSGYVEDVAEKKDPSSERGSAEDVAEMSASASEHRPIEDVAKQSDTEIPMGYENPITDGPLKEETPGTTPTTPIPPVMDRISGPSTSVPYYATPKIMVHKPSQSSEAENSASRTMDEVLADERQSLPQEIDSQLPHSTQDGNLTDAPPMESMSLRPIAWQAPKDQKVKKGKLYLRKIRNAAARKTILKATLGRQLAIPTKQMLRLLANGENLTVPDLSKPGVEAATMLVPQETVGSLTAAVLLPQGVAGAVSDH